MENKQGELRLQRFFSTFAEGWPGMGLLLQRILTSAILAYCGGAHLLGATTTISSIPHLIAAALGIFLLVGLFTPLAGTAIATVEIWISVSSQAIPLIAIVVAILGLSVAMIGPGVWSIDARLYGRKRIEAARPYTS